MYTTEQRGMGGMGFAPLIVAGIQTAIPLIGKLFGGGDEYGKYKSNALPAAQQKAMSTGIPVFDWWFDDVIRVAPDGSWSIFIPKSTTLSWPGPTTQHMGDFIAAYEDMAYEDFWTRLDNVFHLHAVSRPEEITDPRETNTQPVDIQIPPNVLSTLPQQTTPVFSASMIDASTIGLLIGGGLLLYLMMNPIKKGKRKR